jgi:hypothetical protein
MTILTLERVNDFMDGPSWTEKQKNAVRDIIDGVEGNLEGSLSGAYITPRQMFEVAPILRSGMLATRQPVASVQEIDGVVVDEDNPLASPWILTENRLRRTDVLAPPSGLLVLPSTPSAWGQGNISSVEHVGQATVKYMGGWNNERAIVLAMLNKCAAIVRNRFDDTIVADGNDSANAPRPQRETWSKEELAPLGIYRNLGAKR